MAYTKNVCVITSLLQITYTNEYERKRLLPLSYSYILKYILIQEYPTDADLLLVIYRCGSHLTSDIKNDL